MRGKLWSCVSMPRRTPSVYQRHVMSPFCDVLLQDSFEGCGWSLFVSPSLLVCQIAKFLEQRTHKELRAAHVSFVRIITEAYSKLLSICKEQMWVYKVLGHYLCAIYCNVNSFPWVFRGRIFVSCYCPCLLVQGIFCHQPSECPYWASGKQAREHSHPRVSNFSKLYQQPGGVLTIRICMVLQMFILSIDFF